MSYWEWAAYFYLEPDGSDEIHLDDLRFSFDEGEDWAWYEDFETRTDGDDYPYTFGWSTAYSRYPTPLETEMRGGFTNHFARFQANNDYLDKPLELAPQQTSAFDLRAPSAAPKDRTSSSSTLSTTPTPTAANWETADHRWALLSLRYRASDDSFYLDTSPAWVIAGCTGGKSFARTGDWQRVSIYYDYMNDRASVSVDGTLVASWDVEWPTNIDVSDDEVTWESSAVLPEYVAEPGEYFAWLWRRRHGRRSRRASCSCPH